MTIFFNFAISKKLPFLAVFGKIAISQPKRTRQNQQRLSYKIRPAIVFLKM